MLTVENFNVRVVNTGDTYGLDDCLVNNGAELVEFYDKRYMHTSRGQFVSRYYVSTLLRGNGYPNGLCLDGRVDEWVVSGDGMAQVLDYIKPY